MMDPHSDAEPEDQLQLLARHAVGQLHQSSIANGVGKGEEDEEEDEDDDDEEEEEEEGEEEEDYSEQNGIGHVDEDIDEDDHMRSVRTARKSRINGRNSLTNNHSLSDRTNRYRNFDQDDDRDESDHDLSATANGRHCHANGHQPHGRAGRNCEDDVDDAEDDEDDEDDEGEDEDDDDNLPILSSKRRMPNGYSGRPHGLRPESGHLFTNGLQRPADNTEPLDRVRARFDDVSNDADGMMMDTNESEDDIPLASRLHSRVRQERSVSGATGSATVSEVGMLTKTGAGESESDDDVPLAVRAIRLRDRLNEGTPTVGTVSTTIERRVTKRTTKSSGSTERKLRKSRISTTTKVRKMKSTDRKTKTDKEEDIPTVKFEKPGQRRETPPENDPTRLFYQSMYHEKKSLGRNSDLAESWMLRHGLLDHDEAQRLVTSAKRIMVS